jgi:mono/diheme cytochrome c family protein
MIRVRMLRVLVIALLCLVGARIEAQRNGEAYSTTPTVERADYDMEAFMAPLSLNETQLRGRKLFGQRCANCHGGTTQRPGPLLGQPTVARLGDVSIREKVRKGSAMMPGFEFTLEAHRIDDIIAFLKTYTPAPPPRGQAAPQE